MVVVVGGGSGWHGCEYVESEGAVSRKWSRGRIVCRGASVGMQVSLVYVSEEGW